MSARLDIVARRTKQLGLRPEPGGDLVCGGMDGGLGVIHRLEPGRPAQALIDHGTTVGAGASGCPGAPSSRGGAIEAS